MTKEPVRIGLRVTIHEAQEVMRMWGLRHLPVTNEDDVLVGIISDRDLAYALSGNFHGTDSVSLIMTEVPYTASPFEKISDVVRVMAENKYGCTVVVDSESHVMGIFTTTDALHMLSEILREPDPEKFQELKVRDLLTMYRSVS